MAATPLPQIFTGKTRHPLRASLGCGNPTALAKLQPGETVLDLGSVARLAPFGDCTRVTGNAEVISSPIGLVPTNALVLTGLANFGMDGYPETEPHRRRLISFLESEISQTHIRLLLPFLP